MDNFVHVFTVTIPRRELSFTINVKNNIVDKADRIAQWMIGKSIDYVCGWVDQRGGTIE